MVKRFLVIIVVLFGVVVTWVNSRPAGIIITIVVMGLAHHWISTHWTELTRRKDRG